MFRPTIYWYQHRKNMIPRAISAIIPLGGATARVIYFNWAKKLGVSYDDFITKMWGSHVRETVNQYNRWIQCLTDINEMTKYSRQYNINKDIVKSWLRVFMSGDCNKR